MDGGRTYEESTEEQKQNQKLYVKATLRDVIRSLFDGTNYMLPQAHGQRITDTGEGGAEAFFMENRGIMRILPESRGLIYILTVPLGEDDMAQVSDTTQVRYRTKDILSGEVVGDKVDNKRVVIERLRRKIGYKQSTI